MGSLTQPLLKRNLNSTFILRRQDSREIALTLVRVSEIKNQGPYEAYSFEFLGPKDMLLEQGAYELTHETVGVCNVFLAPVGEQASGYEYEAGFSYEKEPSKR